MNKLTLAVLVSTLVLGGCGSTPKTKVSEVRTNEVAINIASTENYIWQNDESVAYNIAKLAQPTGVGVGMRDNADPKSDDMGRSGSTVLSAVSGFFMGGLGGSASSLAMDSKNDSIRDWRISFLTFHHKDTLDLTDPAKANQTVRNELGDKLLTALKHKYPDTQIKGIYSHTIKRIQNITAQIVLSGSICDDALKFGYNKGEQPNLNQSGLEVVLFGAKEPVDGCLVQLTSSISGFIDGNYAAVTEINGYNVSAFVAIEASEHIEDTYVIIPDRSRFRVSGSRLKRTWVFPYPKIIFNGKDYLLDINEVSTSPIL